MADHPRRGRNRPDSKAMWNESDRRGRYGGGARDRRDDRDRYRDDGHRDRDRRQRTRSRSPLGERRERHRSRSRDRRDRDRDHDRERRRGYENTRDKADGRHNGRERDGRRDDDREEDVIPRGPGRRGNPRRSASPPRSPLRKVGRTTHDSQSPLPTRSKNVDKGSGQPLAREDQDADSGFGGKSKGNNRMSRDSPAEDDGRRGRKPNREEEEEAREDVMDEDEDITVEDDEMSAMQAMMGFGGFDTTKGKKVPGNNAGAIYKAKKTEYRQYMNRVGGFNRPLSPGR
ncbi:hypothetical protein F5Y19DRAFT_270213 [Xylariaceae sp. FL1651]|nr:hypothetical protein F5Y19DRAFT_270213 [Xylariaceae sp. FL1651]